MGILKTLMDNRGIVDEDQHFKQFESQICLDKCQVYYNNGVWFSVIQIFFKDGGWFMKK